ncbi:MAG: murein hydrolase activator EnvC [Alphaproteobacteria bacterium]
MVALLFSAMPLAAKESKANNTPSSEDLAKLEEQAAAEKEESKTLKKKAESIGKEIKETRQKMIGVAREIQGQEEILSNLETKLDSLEQEQKDLITKLTKNDKRLIKLIGTLESLAMNPTETIIVQPLEPIDIIRSIGLMKDSIPSIEAYADSIKDDLKTLSSLKAMIQAQYSRISFVRTNLDIEHEEMQKLHKQRLEQKKATETEGKKAAARAKKLAEKADDLRDLLKVLEEEKIKKEKERQAELAAKAVKDKEKIKIKENLANKIIDDTISFAKARGNLPSPVRGKIVTVYGETTKSGSHARGITIETRSNAQVIAPFDGTVLFAGSFRGYGQLLIIEHGGGYHTLLAGMNRIDVSVNQSLLAGEPVGLMSKDKAPDLYLELRKDGQPINPLPWLSRGNNDGIS